MIRKVPLIRHVAAALALPFMAAIVVPALLVARTRALNPGWGMAPPLGLLPVAIGLGLIAGGLGLAGLTVRLFATAGQGTLAPWDPTQRLVVASVYRYVRNPMISGVFGVLLGEAALFGSLPLLAWALAFIGVNAIYMPLFEEPGLRRRFGADYDEYSRHVPRWLPRRTPWLPPPEEILKE